MNNLNLDMEDGSLSVCNVLIFVLIVFIFHPNERVMLYTRSERVVRVHMHVEGTVTLITLSVCATGCCIKIKNKQARCKVSVWHL